MEIDAVPKWESNYAFERLVRQWKRLLRGKVSLLFISVFKSRCLEAYPALAKPGCFQERKISRVP